MGKEIGLAKANDVIEICTGHHQHWKPGWGQDIPLSKICHCFARRHVLPDSATNLEDKK